MREREPFQQDDLAALGSFLDRSVAVVTMEDVWVGTRSDQMIGMRHDCDNEIESAVRMAEWEAERGYRATYYILHTAPYWDDKPLLTESLERIAECGHRIGIHNDAITAGFQTRRDPVAVLTEAVEELRGYGHAVESTVAHGHRLCHIAHYVNDELFVECRRADYGHISRLGGITPVSLAELGLLFDANWLHRGDYLSDSGGEWSQPFIEAAEAWPTRGQLHMLVHPCWWSECWEKVAA